MRAIVLTLFLQALPAAWTRSSITARVTAPLPAGQRELVLHGPLGSHQAIWLHDHGRDHLAIRDPLGPPVLVLRSDGERLGIELLGRPEVVSRASPAIRMLTDGEMSLADLAPLLVGRLPPGTELRRVWGGWRAQKGDLHAGLTLDGELIWAAHSGIRLRPGELSVLGKRFRFEVGELEPRSVPEHAFAVGTRQSVPIEAVAPAAL